MESTLPYGRSDSVWDPLEAFVALGGEPDGAGYVSAETLRELGDVVSGPQLGGGGKVNYHQFQHLLDTLQVGTPSNTRNLYADVTLDVDLETELDRDLHGYSPVVEEVVSSDDGDGRDPNDFADTRQLYAKLTKAEEAARVKEKQRQERQRARTRCMAPTASSGVVSVSFGEASIAQSRLASSSNNSSWSTSREEDPPLQLQPQPDSPRDPGDQLPGVLSSETSGVSKSFSESLTPLAVKVAPPSAPTSTTAPSQKPPTSVDVRPLSSPTTPSGREPYQGGGSLMVPTSPSYRGSNSLTPRGSKGVRRSTSFRNVERSAATTAESKLEQIIHTHMHKTIANSQEVGTILQGKNRATRVHRRAIMLPSGELVGGPKPRGLTKAKAPSFMQRYEEELGEIQRLLDASKRPTNRRRTRPVQRRPKPTTAGVPHGSTLDPNFASVVPPVIEPAVSNSAAPPPLPEPSPSSDGSVTIGDTYMYDGEYEDHLFPADTHPSGLPSLLPFHHTYPSPSAPLFAMPITAVPTRISPGIYATTNHNRATLPSPLAATKTSPFQHVGADTVLLMPADVLTPPVPFGGPSRGSTTGGQRRRRRATPAPKSGHQRRLGGGRPSLPGDPYIIRPYTPAESAQWAVFSSNLE